jgi:Arc/MetJ-type ribon-helix-helix transcriptional regulator
MTRITVSLPDDVAARAERLGLLSDDGIRVLIEDALRREAGRRLLEISVQLQAANISPMSDDEIVAEVKAVRAERCSS